MDPIGVIFGRVGPDGFNMAVAAPSVQRNEYVQANHKMYGAVVGQVLSLERMTNVDYAAATRIVDGQNFSVTEQLVAWIDIIGYRDERGVLQRPRTPFAAGEVVTRAENDVIQSVLGLKPEGRSTAYIGMLKGYSLRVHLDINNLVARHVAILSKTGGGKSYTVGVFIEEMLKRLVPVVVIDPHGEYGSLMFPNNSEEDQKYMKRFGVKPRGYSEHVVSFSPDVKTNTDAVQLSFDSINLTESDLGDFAGATTAGQRTIIEDAIRRVQEGKRFYSIEQLIESLKESKSANKWNVIAPLEALTKYNLFSQQPTKLSDLVKEGQTTIINLKGAPNDVQEVVVNRIIRKLFEARKLGKIPALMLVVEEAHNFCPQQESVRSSAIMRTVASEGRKFGLGLCVVTQRPAKIDKNVLSQCGTQIILKVTNPNDLKAIENSIEGFTEGMREEIQALPTGSALITGGSVTRPILVDVRVRETKHGGEGVKIIKGKARERGEDKTEEAAAPEGDKDKGGRAA